MIRRLVAHGAWWLATLGLWACGGGSRGGQAPLADTCRVNLPPRGAAPTPSRPAPAVAVPKSTLVVSANMPLAMVKRELDAKVPTRVAEERDHDLGVVGRLEYTVDRGAFSLDVRGGALVVEAPLVAHARACARGNCFAACDPEARLVATIPLKLRGDYRLAPSQVAIDVVRGCELRAMGGLVRVDVTPMLRNKLAAESPRIAAGIDARIPSLRGEAERLWATLSRPQTLPLGACVVVLPEKIVQGPSSGDKTWMHLRFGLVAQPELRARCGTPPPAASLPPLGEDAALPEAGDAHLAMVLSPDAPAIALEGAGPLDLGAGRARVVRATGSSSRLDAELRGEVCGNAAVTAASVQWGEDARTVHLGGIALADGEGERLRTASVDASPLTRAVESTSIPLPIAPDQLGAALPALAKSFSDDRVDVTVALDRVHPDWAGLRGDEVVAMVALRGSVTITAR